MIEYECRPFHEVGHEIASKVPEHYESVTHYGPPNVDWDYYLQASSVGRCIAVTARKDGKLIGYSVHFITENVNHKHIIEAESIGVFVDKAERGRTGIELIRKADGFLKQLGVMVSNYALKDERVGRLLARNGYTPAHTIWSNELWQKD